MKFNYYKIGYAIFSLLAGLTVGVLLALFIAIGAFISSLIGFPAQIYKQCIQQYTTRRMQKVFGVAKNTQFGDAKQERQGSVWDKHIQRMEEKKNNINNN